MEVNKNSKQIGYKLTLERIVENLNRAMEKVELQEDIVVYKAVSEGRIREKNINVFNLNPELELKKAFEENKTKITLYKINLKKGINIVGYTNCIFYDNQHKTLPAGMNEDTRIIVDLSSLELEEVNRSQFKKIKFEDEKNDFTNVTIKSVNVIELDEKDLEE